MRERVLAKKWDTKKSSARTSVVIHFKVIEIRCQCDEKESLFFCPTFFCRRIPENVYRGFFLGSLFLGVLFLFFAATTSTAFSGDGTWLRSSASMA